MQSIDHPELWSSAVRATVDLALAAITADAQTITEKQLLTILAKRLGPFSYRRGHGAALRRLYGTVLAGPKLTAYAKGRGI